MFLESPTSLETVFGGMNDSERRLTDIFAVAVSLPVLKRARVIISKSENSVKYLFIKAVKVDSFFVSLYYEYRFITFNLF